MPLKLNKLMALIACVLLLMGLAVPAAAVDVQRESSLTLHYSPFGINSEGAEFSLYQVALLDENGKYSLVGDFAEYALDVSDLTSGTVHLLANTLETYVLRDKPEPMAKGNIGKDNSLLFGGLPVGLYLALGSPYKQGGYTYFAYPVAVSLPTNGEYDLNASPKFEREPILSSKAPERMDLTVLKLWDDAGHEQSRPESVTVQLLRDGEVWDTVVLSGENDWRHEWKALNKEYRWDVAEENIPENYTVFISREGDTCAIMNSYDAPTPGGDTGNNEPDDEWEYSDYTRPTSGSARPYSDKLPQTGMLWWPVPLMAGAGLALFSAGWVLDRKRDGEDEK